MMKKRNGFALFITMIFITIFFGVFSYTLGLYDNIKDNNKKLNMIEKEIIIQDIISFLNKTDFQKNSELLIQNKTINFLFKSEKIDYSVFIELKYKPQLLNINLINNGQDLIFVNLLNKILFFNNIEKPDIIMNLLQQYKLSNKNNLNKFDLQELFFDYFLMTKDFNIFKLDIDKYFTFDNLIINYAGITSELLYLLLYPNYTEEQVDKIIRQIEKFEELDNSIQNILNEYTVFYERNSVKIEANVQKEQKASIFDIEYNFKTKEVIKIVEK